MENKHTRILLSKDSAIKVSRFDDISFPEGLGMIIERE